MTDIPAQSLLELRGITKRYGAFVANDAINLIINPGEIHAILGENGAGKSTLMKTIYGVHMPDEGQILWKGAEVRMESPGMARALGIGMVFQHFSLFETVTVAENISLTVPAPLADLEEKIRAKGDEFGLQVNPKALVHGLSVGERQRVEIIRSLLQDPALLILDEPTSVLPPSSVEQLFQTLRKLPERGVSILYISHKLDEIRALCHRATVLRMGKVAGTADPRTATSSELARLMIGRDIPHPVHPPSRADGEVRLLVQGLSQQNPDPYGVDLKDVSLEVRAGEIVGIAGVSGNGQSILTRLLSGEEVLSGAQADHIQMLGNPVGHLNAEHRRRIGLAFVPEDRLGRGTAPPMSLSENSLLTAHRSGMVKHGFISRQKRDVFTDTCIETMDVRTRGRHSLASSLSGGNLQKFIVGREMMLSPRVLIVSQPTWGIDVGAAAMVRQKLIDLRDQGTAILVISEELEELFEISDRLVVMFDGKISDPVNSRDTNAEEIGQMMIGHFGATRGEAA